MKDRPLKGLKVLEMGQLLAGPFCGSMLAGFGFERGRQNFGRTMRQNDEARAARNGRKIGEYYLCRCRH